MGAGACRKARCIEQGLGEDPSPKTYGKSSCSSFRRRYKRRARNPITDADERRWRLPEKEWKEWEVPFDTDPDWPEELKTALTEYRQAWRQKMDESERLYFRPGGSGGTR